MTNLWMVRSNYGQYTPQFLKGNYAAIGWLEYQDLSDCTDNNEIKSLYRKENPNEKSNLVIGQQAGQISRFLFEMKKGDYILTQSINSDQVHYGIIESDYYFDRKSDDCPFPHRKKVKWIEEVQRSNFSVPFQNTIRSSLTVFWISHINNFFEVIGKKEFIKKESVSKFDYHSSVLNQIMELDATEFELLLVNLLSAMGFEGAEHTGRPGDGGVDAIGDLNVSGLAKMRIFIQAKRYQPSKTIRSVDVKALRQNIPRDGQGAFITTAKFDKKSKEIASDPGFPRIGLINGNQLVELLAENWSDIDNEFKEKLNLRVGLVSK